MHDACVSAHEPVLLPQTTSETSTCTSSAKSQYASVAHYTRDALCITERIAPVGLTAIEGYQYLGVTSHVGWLFRGTRMLRTHVLVFC